MKSMISIVNYCKINPVKHKFCLWTQNAEQNVIKAEQVEQNYACTSTEVTHNTQNVNLKKNYVLQILKKKYLL